MAYFLPLCYILFRFQDAVKLSEAINKNIRIFQVLIFVADNTAICSCRNIRSAKMKFLHK